MRRKIATGALGLALFSTPADAKGAIWQDIDWSADISLGGEYDSAVAIDDIDFFSRKGDTALSLRGKFSGELKVNESTTLKGDYIFTQRSYANLSAFDQQAHLFRAGMETDIGDWRYGLDVRHVNADVGGNAFLDSSQISPSVSRFFGAHWFGQARYTYSTERYSERASRNAEKHRLDVDAYYFFDGPKFYLIAGLDAQTSDTIREEFGYRAIGPSLALVKRSELRGKDMRYSLRWRYEDRRYNDLSILIGEVREDQRHRLNAEAKLNITENIYLAGDIKFGNYSSNLDEADYKEEVIGLKAGYTF